MYNTEVRGPLILGNKSLSQITADITSPLYARPKFWWIVGLGNQFHHDAAGILVHLCDHLHRELVPGG